MTTRTVSAIEEESYAILRSRVDTSALAPLSRAVAERVVHACADLDYLGDLVLDEEALQAGHEALRAGAPLVTDVAMVAAGISSLVPGPVLAAITLPGAAELAARSGLTRSAAGVRLALDTVGPGAVWAIGCAPTALAELVRWGQAARPALVIGLPVGFVGAVEAKAQLRESALPGVSNISEKGGSAVAAAAVNALMFTPAPLAPPEAPASGGSASAATLGGDPGAGPGSR